MKLTCLIKQKNETSWVFHQRIAIVAVYRINERKKRQNASERERKKKQQNQYLKISKKKKGK